MSFEEIWDVLAYDDRNPILRAVLNSLQFSAFHVQIIHFGCQLRKYGTYWHMMTENPSYALCKIVSSFRLFMYKSYNWMSFEEIWDVLAYDGRKPTLRALRNSLQFSTVHVQIIHFGCHLRKYGTYWHRMTENPFYALCKIVSSFRLFVYKSYILDVI